MILIPPPPEDIKNTFLFQNLAAKSLPDDGLIERVNTFVSTVSPLLDLILASPFRDYTLHNSKHSKKLIHLSEYIISRNTLEHLSALEIAIIIISCYLHDLGMCLTSTEREQIISTQEFEDELRAWPQLWYEIENARKQYSRVSYLERSTIESRIFQLQEAGLASFLRSRHGTYERYAKLISKLKESVGRNDLLKVKDVSFENEIIQICVSHNEDVAVLLEIIDAYNDRFPRDISIGGFKVNMQFCAAVLRLTDILDFDRERTPRILFESLGIGDGTFFPGKSVSLQEWNKHMAVHSLEIRTDEVIISADSTHPTIERSIRDYCGVIERETRDTISVLRRNRPEIIDKYQIELPLTVRPRIRSIGYVYKDMAFKFDELSISTLLMGEGLYSNKSVALRELIQNAIDACVFRQFLNREPGYNPLVSVSFTIDEDDRTWLEVTDNGIGMDEHVLSNYFFRIGNSYYRSSEFERFTKGLSGNFTPISRFGIGILSVFMIGDIFQILTRNQFSPRADTLFRSIMVEGRFGLAFVTENETGPHGTTIRVRLNQKNSLAAELFLSNAAVYIRTVVRRPKIPVRISLLPSAFTIDSSSFLGLRESSHEELMKKGVVPIIIDVGRWSKRITGHIVLFFLQCENSLLRHRLEGMKPEKIDSYAPYMKNYHGNRITVNGITMVSKNIGTVLGKKNLRITGAIDIELTGDDDIQYDVSRDKLIGTGITIARNELKTAIIQAVKELGYYNRLHEETKTAIEYVACGKPVDTEKLHNVQPIDNESILSAVLKVAPKEPWPPGLHRIIAEKLEIQPHVVYRAISTLIESGRLQKPMKDDTENKSNKALKRSGA